MNRNHRKQIAIGYILFILLFSLFPFIPTASALVWNPGVTFSCDNEYYSTTTPLTVDNISVDTHWVSVNGIGFNTTAPHNTYINFSTMKSYPKTSTGYIMNFTEQHATGATQYIINGLKHSYAYTWITNGSDYPQTSSATGTLYLNQTGTSRNHKLYDPGIPSSGIFVSLATNTPAGNDATGDGSITAPYATVRKALNMSGTSDTIYIRGGDYTAPGWGSTGVLRIDRSGTKTNPFTISNYNGEKVVIDAKTSPIGTTASVGMFMFYTSYGGSYSSNVTIYGLNFSNCSNNAMFLNAYNTVAKSDNNITISHCSFYNISWEAIYCYGDYAPSNPIQFVNINNCTFNYIQTNGTMGECVTFKGCRNYVFENNTFRNFFKQAVSAGPGGTSYGYIRYNSFYNKYYYTVKVDPSGGNDGISHHIYIYNNLFYGTATYDTSYNMVVQSEQQNDYIHDVYIYNNIFNLSSTGTGIDNGAFFLGPSANSYTGRRIYNVYFTYNTIYCAQGGGSHGFFIKQTTGTYASKISGCVIANNIFTNAGGTQNYQGWFYDLTSSQTNVTVTNNLFYKYGGTSTGIYYSGGTTGYGTNGLHVNPLFYSYSTGNFHLNISSPVIDTALVTYTVPTDYDGNTRPAFAGYDRGAYEYTTGLPPSPSFVFSSEAPTNTSTGLALTPLLSIDIDETHGYKFNYTIQENTTGAWVNLAAANNQNNGTYTHVDSTAIAYSTKYWWRVSVWNGTTYHNETYHFTTMAAPTSITPVVSAVRANWTTGSSIYISWTKGLGTTHSYLYRSTTGYLDGTVLIYNNVGSYYNDTSKNPTIRYYYTLIAYNATTTTWGNTINISLAETDNTTVTTSSSALFKGYMATDKNMWTNFHYATNPTFTGTTANTTIKTEYYNKTHTLSYDFYDTHWAGQTFQVGNVGLNQRYYLHQASFKMFRINNPTTLFVYLYTANATGLPTGAVLSSGSMDATTITTSATGEWYNITMSPYKLLTNTRYALMMKVIGSAANFVMLLEDTIAPTYTGGKLTISNDDGTTFSNLTADAFFRVWGHFSTTYITGLITSNETTTTTGAIDIPQNSLTSGQMYWYYEHGNDSNGNMTKGNIRYTLTNPDIPTFLNLIPYFTNNSVQVTWLKGNGANRTIIVTSNTAYPSTLSEGNISYNDTGTTGWITGISFNTTYYISLFSYTAWGSLCRYSSGIHIPWGGITFIVYNESKPWQVINASMIVTDSLGLYPVQFTNCYGYHSFNISQIPYGVNTLFYISNVSYDSRLYPITIIPNIFYNFSFYLPPLHPPGWNTTTGNASAYYKIQVRDQKDLPVPDASVKTYRYLNTTANYTYIGGFITDGNGEGSVTLFPNQLYMIKINCTGYTEEINFWAPTILDQSTVKIFKIYTVTETPETREYTEEITFNGYINRNTLVIHVNYTDALSDTINAQIIVYELDFHTNTTSVFGVNLTVGDSDVYVSFPGADNLNTYTVVLQHNHSVFGYHRQSFIIGPRIVTITTPGYTNRLWDYNYGTNPLGWSNCLMWLIMVILLFYGGKEELPLVFIAIGVIFEFVNIGIGFFTWAHVAAGAFIPIMFIISGILVGWFRYRG